MSVLKDHYYRLASEVASERIEAASALVSELVAADSPQEYDYALTRLIAGLTSSRQTARFGFSMALAEVIRELIPKESHKLTVASFLTQLADATKISSSMKGKEARSVLFGRLFGLQALVNSGVLLDEKTSADEQIRVFFHHLVALAAAKPWIRETAMYTLCQFITSYMDTKICSNDTLAVVLQYIDEEGLTFSVEGLAVYLTIPQPLRATIASQVSGGKWKNNDPLSRGNLPTLAKVLKDVEVDDDKKTQKGSWSPRIPFVWEIIVESFKEEEQPVEEISGKKRKKSAPLTPRKKTSVEPQKLLVREFWKVVVDETMFSEKASPERKYWGFEIFALFLEKLPASEVASLFTPNMLRCLINQSAKSDRLLHKVSTRILNAMTEVSQRDLTKVLPILASIVDSEKGGSWNFDSLTKSKVCDSLIGVLSYIQDVDSVTNVDQVVLAIQDVLISLFNGALEAQQDADSKAEDSKKTDPKKSENILKWVLDKLLLLVRSTKRFKVTKAIDGIFKFLIKCSFFKSSGAQLSSSIVKLAQDRLNSYLSEVISQRRKEHSWSLYCVKQIEKLEKSSEYELILELDGDLDAIKTDVIEILDTIKDSKKKDDNDQHYCFELLLSMVLIQLYMGEAEAVGVLEEIKTCYAESADLSESGNSAMILTEIILSFISRKSSLLKKLSNIVWESYLCAKGSDGARLNEKCFQLLFDVLKTKENEEGQKALFEAEDEYEMDNDENEGDDNGESDNEGEESDDSDDNDEDDESDGDDDQKVDKETTIKLAKALGIPTETSGEVKFDEIDSFGEDEDYESESMDDEQMMAMDDELSRIFKERHEALSANNTNRKKADSAQAKEQILLFKSKVLDLLESFSKVQPHSRFNIGFIRPIVTLINTTTDKNLGTKAHKILKTRVSKVKVAVQEFEAMTTDEQEAYTTSLLELIEWLQNQAGTYSSNQAHSLACSQSCIIVAKTLVLLDPATLPGIITIYSGALTKWASEPKNRIQASMFFDFINWLNAKRGA